MSKVKIIKPEIRSNAKQFGFRLKPEYREALEKESDETLYDISELIHIAIEEYFNKEERRTKQ